MDRGRRERSAAELGRRRPRPGRILRAAGCLLLLGSVLACQVDAIRTLRGGRLYVSGTEALDRGDHVRAIEALEQAAILVPQASEVQNHLGLAYWSGGDPERARGAFEAALALDCDNDAARTNLARLEVAEREQSGRSGEEQPDVR